MVGAMRAPDDVGMSTAAPRTASSTARTLARETPPTRDRVVDFVRVASIAVVVLGHWLMATVTVDGGRFQATNALATMPWLQRATWVLQVMPLFFVVGGFANAATIGSYRRRGRSGCDFVVTRMRRLLRPVLVLLAVWVPVASALGAVGVGARTLGPATKLVVQPLWFVAVYAGVTALAPLMWRAYERWSWRSIAALALAAVAVDATRFAAGIDAIGALNLAFVWLGAQQLGFAYFDGSLLQLSRRTLWVAAASGLGALAVLTGPLGYPVSMVGLPGQRMSNMDPPSVCLVALTVVQVALVLLARDALDRWLARERVWTVVVGANGIVMTVFSWHLTALLLVLGAARTAQVSPPAPPSALWWLTRPVWIGALAVPLAVLVTIFGRWERPRAQPSEVQAPSRPRVIATAFAVTGVVIGVAGIAATDLTALGEPHRAHVVVLTLSTIQSLVVLLLAAAWFAPRPSRSHSRSL